AVEAVSRRGRDRRAAVRQPCRDARACERQEVLLAACAHVAHRLEDAATAGGNGLVVLAQRAPLLVVEPGGSDHRVSVAVNEAREEDALHLHHVDGGLRNAECGMEVAGFGARTDPGDSLAFDQHGGVLQHLQVRQFTTAAGTGGSATRHDLPGADEEGLQSCASASRIGRRIPWRRAVRSEEHTSELQSQSNLVCRLLLEKKKNSLKIVMLNEMVTDIEILEKQPVPY